MAFQWAGAGYGASKALQEVRERERRQQIEDAELAMKREQAGLTRQVLMEQLAAGKENRERAGRDQQLQEAQTALGQLDAMGQGTEVSPDVAKVLSGTPYGVRLEQKATLPSSTIAATGIEQSDPGGRSYATLAPTVAQQREQGQRADLDALISSLGPDAKNLATLERAGIRGLNVHDLEGTDRHLGHVRADEDRGEQRANRIADYQHGLAVQRDKTNEERQSRFTRGDLLGVMRDARTRAVADFTAMVRANDGYAPTDEQGNEITPDVIAQQYVDEALSALEAFEEQPAPAAGGRKIVEGIRKRIAAPTNARPVVALYPRNGRGSGAGSGQGPSAGKVMTRAQLQAIAERNGVSLQAAEQQAKSQGYAIR